MVDVWTLTNKFPFVGKILPASIVQGSVFLSIQLIDFLFLKEFDQALGESVNVSISGTLMKVNYL